MVPNLVLIKATPNIKQKPTSQLFRASRILERILWVTHAMRQSSDHSNQVKVAFLSGPDETTRALSPRP